MNIKRYAMAGGVLVTAAAIGFVMQNGQSAKARYADANVPDISGTLNEPLQVTDITLTSALTDISKPDQRLEAAQENPTQTPEPDLRQAALQEPVVTSDALPAPEPLCAVTMQAEAVAAAMVELTLDASCFPNERVTLHHNGMMFTYATDDTGALAVTVPALAANAVFIAAFANGEGTLANAKVTTLEFYDRLVVQSKASSELHINAFEFGAQFQGRGHIYASSGHSMADAATGNNGFITSLGDPNLPEALVAEVYTYPTGTSKQQGEVEITVDAEVTTGNCGLRVDAQTLEVRRGSAMKVQDLTLPIPSCEAVGDFLVLQNLLQNLKVARN